MSEPNRFRDLVDLQPVYLASDDRLNRFYVPTLRVATHYDRLVGYWRSSSLAVAAAGLVRFLHNARASRRQDANHCRSSNSQVPTSMRSTGECLSRTCSQSGFYFEPDSTDIVIQHRLGVLAWLVQNGMLEIKIGVPLDGTGRPLRRHETDRLFHTKYGILTDTEGDRIAFVGSSNESAAGWRSNHEGFSVYRSWQREIWQHYGQPWVEEFKRHWDEDEPVPGWRMYDLPEAATEDLLERVPSDPFEKLPISDPVEAGDPVDIGDLRRIVEAPAAEGGTGVGFVDPADHSVAPSILNRLSHHRHLATLLHAR